MARAAGCCLSDAVSGLGGKAGSNIGAFLAKIDVLREQTQGMKLKDVVDLVLKAFGLIEHYKADREGEDRSQARCAVLRSGTPGRHSLVGVMAAWFSKARLIQYLAVWWLMFSSVPTACTE